MRTLIVVSVFLLFATANADDQIRQVLGPGNAALYDGANALMAGNAREGVRLTLTGLGTATNKRERLTGYANLCAGYVLLDDLQRALEYCNRALALDDRHWRSYNNRALIYVKLKRYSEAEEDIVAGQALNPQSVQLKVVKSMLLDQTNPVSPRIEIDDRPHNEQDQNES